MSADTTATLSDLNSVRKRFPSSKAYSSYPLPGTAKPGYSPVYRNASSPEKLHPSACPGLSTLHELFQNAVNLFGDDDCMGRRLTTNGKLDDYYTFESYRQIDQRRTALASGIINLVVEHEKFVQNESSVDIDGKPKFVVSISGVNSPEMILTDLATRSFSIPNTGLYDSLSEESAYHILKLTESPILIINKSLLPKFLNLKRKFNLESLFLIVTFEDIKSIESSLLKEAHSLGLDVLDFKKVESFGAANRLPSDFHLPKPETLYTLAFTSGTTGLPKGVYLTHENATANVTGFIVHCPKPAIGLPEKFENDFSYNKDSKGRQLRGLCFLPLVHNLEKSVANFELSYGIALGFPSLPGTMSLMEDLTIIRPSFFCGVPRVFTVIENRIKALVTDSGIKDEDLLSKSVAKAMGFDNLSYLFCASAPISKDSIVFLKKILNCGFMNSYGATECFSVVTFPDPHEIRPGSSGPIGVTSEIKLKDISEMGYSTKDKPFPRGEVLVRGYSVFSHYFKNENATRSAIDEEGWYHTGDVASIDERGNLFIIDRVKNFFKLAQGEYVTPEKVENIYLANNPLLTQLFVHGDPVSEFLVGIAGIDPISVKKFLAVNGFQNIANLNDDSDFLKALTKPDIKKAILDELSKSISKSDLQGYEKIHNLHLEYQPLTVENEALTPTFKLKRLAARKVHHDTIRKLYTEGSLVKPRNKL